MQIARYTFESLLEPLKASSTTVSDIEVVEEAEPAPPPPPTFSEAEMAEARRAAYDDGFGDGKREGKRETDHDAQLVQQHLRDLTERVQAELPIIGQQYRDFISNQRPQLEHLVLAAAERLAFEALAREPLADIAAMMRQCLDSLMGSSEVRITVHPNLADPVQGMFGREAVIVPDAAIQPGECKVAWQHGQSHRSPDAIRQQTQDIIHRHFAKAELLPEPEFDEAPVAPIVMTPQEEAQTEEDPNG